MTKNRKKSDKTYLERKQAKGWKRLWIPPELVEKVRELIKHGGKDE